MIEQQKEVVKQTQERQKDTLFIDLDAFIKDIQIGDSEWFQRIATRELQKLKTTRKTRD